MLECTHSTTVRILERFGGASRLATLLTFAIHFLHPLFSLTNYIYWARLMDRQLGLTLVRAYIAMDIIACVAYLFAASVFYMWAWRFPEPEEVAKRRRIYGIGINLLLSDVPIFVIETMIVQKVKFANGVQGFTYVVTCVSCAYSLLRFWTFWMVRMIKVRLPHRYNDRYSIAQPRYGFNNNNNRNEEDLDRMMEELENDGYGEEENGRDDDDDDDVDDGDGEDDDNNDGDFYGPSASRYYDNNNNNRNNVGFRTPPGTTIIGANNCNDADDGNTDGYTPRNDYYNNNDDDNYNNYRDDEPYSGENGDSKRYGNTRARRRMAADNNNTSTPSRPPVPPVARSSTKKKKNSKDSKYGGTGRVVI